MNLRENKLDNFNFVASSDSDSYSDTSVESVELTNICENEASLSIFENSGNKSLSSVVKPASRYHQFKARRRKKKNSKKSRKKEKKNSESTTQLNPEIYPLRETVHNYEITLPATSKLVDTVETISKPHLRPIVIDGSNVAMAHGKVAGTFSAKGIKLAVEYFLKRGHNEITAFVPRYRQFRNLSIPTTDHYILNELEKQQRVVFTPSRRLNGNIITSYDDRFIVHLATINGGVIVSNDNYRDIKNESLEWKETVDKRLLMYCFEGDIFMVPEDPLGRDGPCLSEFLSLSP